MLENSQSLHYFLVRKCIVKFMTFTSFLYPSFSPRPAAAAAASAAISFFLFQPLQTKIFGIEKCLPPFVVANLLLLFKLTVLILSLSIHLSSLSFSLSLSSTTLYLLSFYSFSLLYLQTLFFFLSLFFIFNNYFASFYLFLSSLCSTTLFLRSPAAARTNISRYPFVCFLWYFYYLVCSAQHISSATFLLLRAATSYRCWP